MRSATESQSHRVTERTKAGLRLGLRLGLASGWTLVLILILILILLFFPSPSVPQCLCGAFLFSRPAAAFKARDQPPGWSPAAARCGRRGYGGRGATSRPSRPPACRRRPRRSWTRAGGRT